MAFFDVLKLKVLVPAIVVFMVVSIVDFTWLVIAIAAIIN